MSKKPSPWAGEPPPILLPDRSREILGETRDAPRSDNACLKCGRVMPAVTGVGNNAAPDPGDAAICFDCGHIMVYADDLSFREATRGEIKALKGDAIVRAIVEFARRRSKNK